MTSDGQQFRSPEVSIGLKVTDSLLPIHRLPKFTALSYINEMIVIHTIYRYSPCFWAILFYASTREQDEQVK